MAKKRRFKHQGPFASATKTVAMSAHDPPFANPLRSARLSSDGTPSEGAASEGALTAMTSVIDTDDDFEPSSLSAPDHHYHHHHHRHNDHVRLDARHDARPLYRDASDDYDDYDYDDDDDELETESLYPVSHYPRSTSPHGTVMQFYLDDPRNAYSDNAASTRSLEYYMPNDEIEQLRLSLQHQVFLHLLKGDVTCVPLEDPKYILDVGTGTGEWPIRMAELFPHCEVVGTDISAIAETQSVPMNVFFEIEDAEEWDRPSDHYDLIHFRCMEGAFRDWRYIYDSVYDSLKPGGYIELIDFDSLESVKIWFTAFSEGSPIFDMARDLEIAAEKIGRKRGIAHMDPQLLVESGFVDVEVTEHAIPMLVGEKSAGKLWLISCLDALEANCLRLLTQQMGWDPEKCKVACEQAARELANLAKDPEKAKGLLVKARTIAARKPLEARSRSASQSPSRSPSAELDGSRHVTVVSAGPDDPLRYLSGRDQPR
ncbi:hypothetical protein CDD83_9563 [Cordyceps sp. RAO-2017]|nr:hypothetical protein CDD83_9563 [Cordyceps sp. RAO-2017]